MPESSVEIWYLTKHGHADNPRFALRDRQGNPLISPGPVKLIVREIKKNQNRTINKLWDELLDAMERIDEAREEGWGDNDKDVAKMLGEQDAFCRCLAILNYPNEFEEDEDKAMQTVMAQANKAFQEG